MILSGNKVQEEGMEKEKIWRCKEILLNIINNRPNNTKNTQYLTV